MSVTIQPNIIFFPARQLLNEASCWLHVFFAFLHVVVRILKEKQTFVNVVIPGGGTPWYE